MAVTRYVLDAWALLAFLQKEEPAATRMSSLLHQAKAPSDIELYASVLNLGEVYYRIAKRKNETAAYQTLALFRRLSMRPVSATDERVYAAARFKGRFAVSYADAFACTTSQELDAILLTGDPEIIHLSGLLQLEVLTRN
ncbi:MAG: type II toxin-antitoxin system VapC family toxin [Caldilineaceae bacterium]|nr:type II toxin-antitoxin system VapC family toxin [Caldilineaceae bacterium]